MRKTRSCRTLAFTFKLGEMRTVRVSDRILKVLSLICKFFVEKHWIFVSCLCVNSLVDRSDIDGAVKIAIIGLFRKRGRMEKILGF